MWRFAVTSATHGNGNGFRSGEMAHGQDGVTVRQSQPMRRKQVPDGAFFYAGEPIVQMTMKEPSAAMQHHAHDRIAAAGGRHLRPDRDQDRPSIGARFR